MVSRACHFIDGLAKKVSKSTSFKQALKSDVSAYEKAVKQANGFPHVEQARYAISAELRNLGDKTHSLQDIFGGAIKKWYPGARWGHKDHYWRHPEAGALPLRRLHTCLKRHLTPKRQT